MGASRCCPKWLWLGLGLLGSGVRVASASGAEVVTQAQLAVALTSGDLLSAEGAPGGATLGDSSTTDERRVGAHTGRENRAWLELGAVTSGYLTGFETEGRLRLELSLAAPDTSTVYELQDGGSWTAVGFRGVGYRVRFRAFPIDTNYQRLGYLHALDWGGSDVERGESVFVQQRGGVPGLELELIASRVGLFAGLRWARAPLGAGSAERLWGLLLGGNLAPTRELRADFGLGYFERAPLLPGPSASNGFVAGASARVMWRRGPTEPELASEPLRPPSLRDAAFQLWPEATPGFALALEGVVLATRLRRFEAPEQAAIVPAPAAAVYGSLRGSVLAGHAVLLWRSLPFVLRNDPGVVRGESSPRAARELGEVGAWAGLSATLFPWRLTPSFALGLLMPAALEAPSTLPGFTQSFVVRDVQGIVALPVGSGRLPVAFARVALRWQLSTSMALGTRLVYERDPNRVRLGRSSRGATRTFASPDQLTLGGSLQARF